jgi:hypothetical protein
MVFGRPGWRMVARSAPLVKYFPVPVTTKALTEESAPASWKAASVSSTSFSDKAL